MHPSLCNKTLTFKKHLIKTQNITNQRATPNRKLNRCKCGCIKLSSDYSIDYYYHGFDIGIHSFHISPHDNSGINGCRVAQCEHMRW